MQNFKRISGITTIIALFFLSGLTLALAAENPCETTSCVDKTGITAKLNPAVEVVNDATRRPGLKENATKTGPTGRVASVYIPALDLLPLGAASVSRAFSGLMIPPGFQNGARGLITIPSDWNGVSDFTVDLYFIPASIGSGIVSFFIRPTGRKVGQTLDYDPGSVTAPGVDVPANSTFTLFVQRFTVTGRVSADDDIFHLYSIQREGPGETYSESVTLLGVKISYMAR